MKTDKEIIDEVVFETDLRKLENGTIKDIQEFLHSIVGKQLAEGGAENDDFE